jgi:hypothetical protein
MTALFWKNWPLILPQLALEKEIMRINIYGDELNKRVGHEKKTPKNSETEYIGIHFFVGRDFKHTPGDDDTSAVTFWYHNEYDGARFGRLLRRPLS